MYDSSSGWMVGPLWQAPDAEAQIEAFLDWMRRERYVGRAEEIGLASHDIPSPLLQANDPRYWPASGLAKLITYWRLANLDEHGLLRGAVSP